MEAVELHQRTGLFGLQVALRLGLAGSRLGRRGVAGDEREAFAAGVEAVAPQHAPDTAGGELDAAPLGPGQLGGDARRSEAGLAEGEGDDALLHERTGAEA